MRTSFFDNPDMLAPAGVISEDLGNGSFVLRASQPLGDYVRCIGEWLDQWARDTPDTLYLAERNASGEWRKLDYCEVRQLVGALAQSLLDMALPQGKPVVILSDNSIDHALLMLACLYIGRPVSTVSSAYSRLAKEFTKLNAILAELDPALIYASDAAVYGAAIKACACDAPVVFSVNADIHRAARDFARLLDNQESAAVSAAFKAIRPDDHAKYLLTSGSTGTPKVVINTHRMLCANQQAIAQVWRFLEVEKPVVLDWLPWSHTFGTNHNFNLILRNGGTLYIDEGRPLPGLIEKTAKNLREVRPTLYFNVPRGFDALASLLEQDDALAMDFFARLRGLFYAGAALPQPVWERLEAVAKKVHDQPVWFTSAWGATETSPLVTSIYWRTGRAGSIGLPVPGTELKFVPNGEKLEMRVRGISVFPGYRNAPELSRKAFDEDGFYIIGDAGYLIDPARPQTGVAFNGRVAEDFKLTTGTWVSVGTLRLRVVAALSPLAQDVVITGHDRDEVGVLVFPSPALKEMSAEEVASRLRAALQNLRKDGGGSSQCPARAIVLDEPASVDAGEITDKGYINQRAVLLRRKQYVEALYATELSASVICVN